MIKIKIKIKRRRKRKNRQGLQDELDLRAKPALRNAENLFKIVLVLSEAVLVLDSIRLRRSPNHQLAITRRRRVIDLDNAAPLVCLYVYEPMVTSHSGKDQPNGPDPPCNARSEEGGSFQICRSFCPAGAFQGDRPVSEAEQCGYTARTD